MPHPSHAAASARVLSSFVVSASREVGRRRAHPHAVWVTLLVLFLPLSWILAGCGGSSEWEADSVTQLVTAAEGAALNCLDGKVSLQIPADALAEDTEVTLSVLPRDEWTDDETAVEPLGAVFRLEPDGLELLKPVGFAIRLDPADVNTLDLEEGTVPASVILTRSGDGRWELADNLSTLVDADTGQFSVAGETAHFSDAVVSYDRVTVTLTPRSVTREDSEPWLGDVQVTNHNRVPISLGMIQSGASGAVGYLFYDDGLLDSTDSLRPGGSRSFHPSWRCETTGQGEFLAAVSYARERRYSEWVAAQQSLDSDADNPGADVPRDYDFGAKNVLVVVSGAAQCYVAQNPAAAPGEQSAPGQEQETGGAGEERRPIGELTFNPDPGDFHDVTVGTRKLLTISLLNTGALDAEIRSFLWPTSQFSAVSTVPRGLTLPVGASYDFTIQFAPKEEGPDASQIMVLAAFPYKGEDLMGLASASLLGNGVLTEVSSLLMNGSWECADAGALTTLDFQVALKDETGGENTISEVNVYIDDLSTAAYSSGPISLTEFPPPPGMIFRRDVEPGIHEVLVEAFTADGERYEKGWKIDCSLPGGGKNEFAYTADYAHIEPGRSETYFDVEGPQGAHVEVDLDGPGVVSDAHQSGVVGPDGKLRLTWDIDAYGEYEVSGTIDDEPVLVVLIVRSRRVQ